MQRLMTALILILFSNSVFALENSKLIDGRSFGNAWPLTFNNAKVSCLNRFYVFVYNIDTNERYPVNGTAKNAVKSGNLEGTDIDNVWKMSPNKNGQRVNIGPVLDEGFSLCDR